MGLFSRSKPKIKIQTTKKDGFSGWIKCSGCSELIHLKELEKNLNVCAKCEHHYRLSVKDRIRLLCDEGSFEEKDSNLSPVDSLQFVDSMPYPERLEKAMEESDSNEGVVTGEAKVNGITISLAVMDFTFMAGSMGAVVGEKITRAIEYALDNRIPLVTIATSGGARMQESILSLMQMAKTSAALARLHEERIPYISILTNPTAGGVTASFASLGDIIIAEPKALICFAGPRVIEQVIKEKLPPGAQKSEFLLKNGMIDCIVNRNELKETLAGFLEFLTGNEKSEGDQMVRLDQPGKLPRKLQELMNMPTSK
jgi:acetyl-CoA carboxylase carboxyl transferase subunit beta